METPPAAHGLEILLSCTLSHASTRGDLSNHGVPLTESCARRRGEEQQPQARSGLGSVMFLCHNIAGPEEECEDEECATRGTPGRLTEPPVEGGIGPLCEHSYSLRDTNRTQLWSRIAGLRAKVLTLDKQEECTHSRIKSVEREIEHLKRHKVLEEYFTSFFL